MNRIIRYVERGSFEEDLERGVALLSRTVIVLASAYIVAGLLISWAIRKGWIE